MNGNSEEKFWDVEIVYVISNGVELQAGVGAILFVLTLLYILLPFCNFCFVMIIQLLQYMELVDSYHNSWMYA
jgi:hypothetical protein